MKRNRTRRFVNFIDKHPVALDMTFKGIIPFSMQRMVFTLRRQRLFSGNHFDDFIKFIEVSAAFSHQLPFFFESLCVDRLQHGLLVVEVVVRIVPVKVCQHLLNGVKTAERGRNLAPHHGPAFLNHGDGLGVGHIVVRGANRALARREQVVVSVGRCRGEGNHSPPRRNFRGNVNDEPVVGGYFYGFRNVHVENIA